jgi:hypothetical protein
LAAESVRNCVIGLPSSEEHPEIVRILESVLAKADVIEAKYKGLKE